MTGEEFQTWWHSLQVAYPGIGDWMRHSIEPEATLTLWERLLADVPLTDAMGILASWLDGREEAPLGWERAQIPTRIRTTYFTNFERRRRHAIASREGRIRAGGAFEAVSECKAAYLEGVAIKRRFDSGGMTRAEYDSEVDALVKRYKVVV